MTVGLVGSLLRHHHHGVRVVAALPSRHHRLLGDERIRRRRGLRQGELVRDIAKGYRCSAATAAEMWWHVVRLIFGIPDNIWAAARLLLLLGGLHVQAIVITPELTLVRPRDPVLLALHLDIESGHPRLQVVQPLLLEDVLVGKVDAPPLLGLGFTRDGQTIEEVTRIVDETRVLHDSHTLRFRLHPVLREESVLRIHRRQHRKQPERVRRVLDDLGRGPLKRSVLKRIAGCLVPHAVDDLHRDLLFGRRICAIEKLDPGTVRNPELHVADKALHKGYGHNLVFQFRNEKLITEQRAVKSLTIRNHRCRER